MTTDRYSQCDATCTVDCGHGDAEEPYDRDREEHARDLLRSWADAASNAGCPPAFVARMRTFADMHDRHATEAATTGRHAHYIDGEVYFDPAGGPCVLAERGQG